MPRALTVAAEDAGQHAALEPGILDLCHFSAAVGQSVEFCRAGAGFADKDAVLKIQMRKQRRAYAGRAE